MSGISLLLLSHGVRCFEDLYSPTLNRRCTASWLLTSQLCHSIPMFLLSSSHRHGATEATHLSHNQTTATDHGARCTSPGRRNSGSTPFTLSPLTETPRLIRILWPRDTHGQARGGGRSYTAWCRDVRAETWLHLYGCGWWVKHTVSHWAGAGCSYTVWKGVWEEWMLAARTLYHKEKAVAVLTLSEKARVRVCVCVWQLWVLAARTLYYREKAVAVLTLSQMVCEYVCGGGRCGCWLHIHCIT
jgi:hypothetical protein